MHTHVRRHTNSHSKRARGGKKRACIEAARRRAACQKSGRERDRQREREREKKEGERRREQEGPYIAHRKSCVRAGSSIFGHGGFLASWKTDISSTSWLLERGSHEGL